MSALAADKSAVCDGSHWLKLIARDAVGAPHYGHGHRYIQQEPLFLVKVPAAMNFTWCRLQECENSQMRYAGSVINHRAAAVQWVERIMRNSGGNLSCTVGPKSEHF